MFSVINNFFKDVFLGMFFIVFWNLVYILFLIILLNIYFGIVEEVVEGKCKIIFRGMVFKIWDLKDLFFYFY